MNLLTFAANSTSPADFQSPGDGLTFVLFDDRSYFISGRRIESTQFVGLLPGEH